MRQDRLYFAFPRHLETSVVQRAMGQGRKPTVVKGTVEKRNEAVLQGIEINRLAQAELP